MRPNSLECLNKPRWQWCCNFHMVEHGVNSVRSGKYDAVKFEIMGMEEAEIRELMSEYPDVPYILNISLPMKAT